MSTVVFRSSAAVLIGAMMIAVIAGCTFQPPATAPSASHGNSPEGTGAEPAPGSTARPAFDTLELSSEGLGTLTFGQPPETDPALSMVVFDPSACTDPETGAPLDVSAGSLLGGWFIHPDYEAAPTAEFWNQPFGFTLDSDAGNLVESIYLNTDQIPTDGGVRIGDDRADVVTGHPRAVLVDNGLTDIYVVTGTKGNLLIEVATRSTPDEDAYWGSANVPDGRVVYIHAVVSARGVVSLAASEFPGGCGLT